MAETADNGTSTPTQTEVPQPAVVQGTISVAVSSAENESTRAPPPPTETLTIMATYKVERRFRLKSDTKLKALRERFCGIIGKSENTVHFLWKEHDVKPTDTPRAVSLNPCPCFHLHAENTEPCCTAGNERW